MNKQGSSYQQLFLERLATRFASRSALVQEVAKVLHVGRDAVYRRLRGDTALTADEMMLLAEVFKLRIQLGGPQHGRVPSLRYPNGRHSMRDEFDHFIHLQLRLNEMKKLPGVSFDFASPELPMYYELSMPTLRSFKIFMFGITSWNLQKWKGLDFSPDLISEALHGIVEQTIYDHYAVPARELWSISILDVTLRQVNYLAQVGRFADREDIHRIYDELLTIIDHLEHMVRSGKRFPMGTEPTDDSSAFRVYHNELSNTSNVVLVKSETSNVLFTTLVTPNYVASANPSLYGEVQDWFDNLVEHGNALHFEAGKYAAQYFGYLRNQVREHRNRVEITQAVF